MVVDWLIEQRIVRPTWNLPLSVLWNPIVHNLLLCLHSQSDLLLFAIQNVLSSPVERVSWSKEKCCKSVFCWCFSFLPLLLSCPMDVWKNIELGESSWNHHPSCRHSKRFSFLHNLHWWFCIMRTSWMTRRVEDVSWKSALGIEWENQTNDKEHLNVL